MGAIKSELAVDMRGNHIGNINARRSQSVSVNFSLLGCYYSGMILLALSRGHTNQIILNFELSHIRTCLGARA